MSSFSPPVVEPLLVWLLYLFLGRLRRVLPQVTLRGSTPFLAPVSCPSPAVEPCWVGGVFGALLGFIPCAVLFLRGLRFTQFTLPQVTLGGFLTFCHRVPDLLLPWWRRLGDNPSLMLSVLLLRRLACRG